MDNEEIQKKPKKKRRKSPINLYMEPQIINTLKRYAFENDSTPSKLLSDYVRENMVSERDGLIFGPGIAVRMLDEDQVITQTFEELGELTQALSKKKRCLINDKTLRKSKEEIDDNLIEEIADVEICLKNLKLLFNIDEKLIKEKKDEKLKRMEKLLLSNETNDEDNIKEEVIFENEE